jgi:hypothetical protein
MVNELARRIGERSDGELYEMIFVNRQDWTPAALELAEKEWARRELAPDKLKDAQAVYEVKKLDRDAIANEPLSTRQKVLFFLFNFAFCLGIPQIVMASATFRSCGYERKYRESIQWMLYGLISFFVAFWSVNSPLTPIVPERVRLVDALSI